MAEELGVTGTQLAELRLERGEVLAHAGEIEPAREDLEVAVSRARDAGDRSLELSALGELGFLLAGAADYREAVGFLEEALRLAEATGNRAQQVGMLSRRSIVSTNLLQLDRASELGEQALALARETADERLVARALDGLKQVALQLGDASRLEEITDELIQIHRRHRDLWYLQFVHFERAYVWMGIGRWDAAVAELRKSQDINRRIEDRGNEPLLLATLGRYHALRGEYREALDAARRSIDLARYVGHAEWTSWSELLLGSTLLDLHAVDEAAPHLERATEGAESAGALLHLVRGAALLGWCRWRLGDHGEANRWRTRAEDLLAEVSTPPGTAYLAGSDAYLAVARIQLASGDARGARNLLLSLLDAAESHSWVESIVRGSLLTALCHRALGNSQEAERALGKALEAAQAVGLPRDELEARGALASLRRAEGRFEEAAQEHAAGRAVVETLSAQIGDESIRLGFVSAALRELEEEGR